MPEFGAKTLFALGFSLVSYLLLLFYTFAVVLDLLSMRDLRNWLTRAYELGRF